MTPPNGPPPPFPDYPDDTPRPTPPPPPRRTASPHAYGEVRESLIQYGRFALRNAVEKLFRAGLTHAEVSREVHAVMQDGEVLF